jgi:uncharacterized protein YqiB (DUF1249 family)
VQLANKKAYKVDLTKLHSTCEANYARFIRLFPEYQISNKKEFKVGFARVLIEVVERCRYTTIFRVLQHGCDSKWIGGLNVEVRLYHDANMAEVGMFQSQRRIEGRYKYPNQRMFQQDEKSQQNGFLADWLEHCLHRGISLAPLPILTGKSGD